MAQRYPAVPEDRHGHARVDVQGGGDDGRCSACYGEATGFATFPCFHAG
jgi:hypothetical protein